MQVRVFFRAQCNVSAGQYLTSPHYLVKVNVRLTNERSVNGKQEGSELDGN